MLMNLSHVLIKLITTTVVADLPFVVIADEIVISKKAAQTARLICVCGFACMLSLVICHEAKIHCILSVYLCVQALHITPVICLGVLLLFVLAVIICINTTLYRMRLNCGYASNIHTSISMGKCRKSHLLNAIGHEPLCRHRAFTLHTEFKHSLWSSLGVTSLQNYIRNFTHWPPKKTMD